MYYINSRHFPVHLFHNKLKIDTAAVVIVGLESWSMGYVRACTWLGHIPMYVHTSRISKYGDMDAIPLSNKSSKLPLLEDVKIIVKIYKHKSKSGTFRVTVHVLLVLGRYSR